MPPSRLLDVIPQMLKRKLNPLTRLTMAFDSELTLMDDPLKEAALADKYLARVQETSARRDNTLKGLVVLNAFLAIASSGKSVNIPGVGISMSDIPALMEVLIGLVSVAFYLSAHSFMTWLCYSQIHHVFAQRIARKKGIDPDLFSFADTSSEPALKMLRPDLNIWGADWYTAGKGFKVTAKFYEICNTLFFLMLPVLHCMLLAHAVMRVISASEVGTTHIVFFGWVALAHLLAVFVWVVPNVVFTFILGETPMKEAKP
jgi:hypothetical protein